MSTQNKDIVRRLAEELWNHKKLELIDREFLPDFRNVGPGTSEVTDLMGFREKTKMVFTAFPDFHVEIVDLIAEGDSVVVIWRAHGTFKADYKDTPANNKLISWSGVTVHRLHNGKIKESVWGYDIFGAAQQMGMIPTLASEAG